jgi:diaminopimelate decarboxylase
MWGVRYGPHSPLFSRAVQADCAVKGVGIELAIRGIRATVDFALLVNSTLGRKQIDTVDIGGGLSVNFGSDQVTPCFGDYSTALQAAVPELFDGTTFTAVVTEFGRALAAKQGFFGSRVEYVKETGGRRIAIQYAGADTCVRTVYQPTQWPLRVSILDGNFVERDMVDLAETDLAGPCCFQADIVAHKRMLPRMHRGDVVLLHDVGAYYHSSHTTYNLRQSPAVWGYEDLDGGGFKLSLLQPAQTVDQTLEQFCESK